IMKTYLQSGDVLTVIAPAAVTSGEFVVVGDLYGVASASAAAGEPVEIKRSGVHRMPKASATTFNQGDKLQFAAGNFAPLDSGEHVATALTAGVDGQTTFEAVIRP
ncbi:MAG: DUF2190 family protein, partial [Pseudomonadota bacterium]